MGGYAEYAFGKSGNFMANYTYGVSLLIANVAIAISAVGYGTDFRKLGGQHDDSGSHHINHGQDSELDDAHFVGFGFAHNISP
ncbi:hypothetical protein, partial [Citrobacter braakii]|uniref:hypothetical protein n=1 Tax=Citrobacter braakii TaxID=57706 RepID=UPI0037C141CE